MLLSILKNTTKLIYFGLGGSLVWVTLRNLYKLLRVYLCRPEALRVAQVFAQSAFTTRNITCNEACKIDFHIYNERMRACSGVSATDGSMFYYAGTMAITIGAAMEIYFSFKSAREAAEEEEQNDLLLTDTDIEFEIEEDDESPRKTAAEVITLKPKKIYVKPCKKS